jgi:hypothetical protein
LEIVDKCMFGGCALEPYDYQGLQLWLFQLHDFVTRRIVLEYHHLYCQLAHSRQVNSVNSSVITLDTEQNLQQSIGQANCSSGQYLATSTALAVWPPVDVCPLCLRTSTSLSVNEVNSSSPLLSLDELSTAQIWNKESVLESLRSAFWEKAWFAGDTPVDSSDLVSARMGGSSVLAYIANNEAWVYLLLAIVVNGTLMAIRAVTVVCIEVWTATTLRRKRSDSEGESELV